MFDWSEAREVFAFGEAKSAAWSEENATAMEVVAGVFRGAVRDLAFDASGDLLVVAGLGVRRLDPDTLEERGRWLDGVHVVTVRPCGERLWVVADGALHLTAWGEPLGDSLAPIDVRYNQTYAAGGAYFAAPEEMGLRVVSSAGEVRELTFDPEWYEALWSKQRPERAMISPSGTYAAAGRAHGGYTVVWDLATGELLGASEHTESHVVFDDGRVLKADERSSGTHDVRSGTWAPLEGRAQMETAVVAGDRVLGANARGDWVLQDVGTLEVLAEGEGVEKTYGRGTSAIASAVSPTHVATYAAKEGVLFCASEDATATSRGWQGMPESLSVSADSTRLVVFREWTNGRLECVDLTAGTVREVTDAKRQGVEHGCVTGDGQHVAAPCGSILRARTVTVGDFDGAASEPLQKIKSCCRATVAYGDDRYAVATYTLSGSGFVGLYAADSKRAKAKVTHGSEQPWRVAVGYDADELFVSWKSVAILYDMAKRPKPVETFDDSGRSIALGPRGYLAYSTSTSRDDRQVLVRTPDRPDVAVPLTREGSYEADLLAFSADGALLFVGAPDGTLEVRRARDGEVLSARKLHAGAFTDMIVRGDVLWTMGKDGCVFALGVPA